MVGQYTNDVLGLVSLFRLLQQEHQQKKLRGEIPEQRDLPRDQAYPSVHLHEEQSAQQPTVLLRPAGLSQLSLCRLPQRRYPAVRELTTNSTSSGGPAWNKYESGKEEHGGNKGNTYVRPDLVVIAPYDSVLQARGDMADGFLEELDEALIRRAVNVKRVV